MHSLSSAIGRIGFGGLLAAASALAQGTTQRTSFEVASVQRVDFVSLKGADRIKRERGMRIDGAQVDISAMPLSDIVRQAYLLRPGAFSGPGWMSREQYDIHAKLPAGTAVDEVPRMLQSLLADRFHLAFHYESQEQRVYALTVARGGLRMKETDPASAAPEKSSKTDGDAMLWNRAMTMPALCDFLSRFLDYPAVDQTGLTATYEVSVEIPFDELKRAKMAAEGRPIGDTAADPPGSTVMTGVVRQLGLKLEPKKLPVNVLAVDHAEKNPTAN